MLLFRLSFVDASMLDAGADREAASVASVTAVDPVFLISSTGRAGRRWILSQISKVATAQGFQLVEKATLATCQHP